MVTAVWTIIIFCVIIAIHEFGHLVSAKLSGVTVLEFAIGMGPKIFSFEKGGTKYTLRLLPIGGYCSMDGEDSESVNPDAFCNKSIWKRFIILSSGAFMNMLLGFVIFVGMFSFLPQQPSNVIGEIVDKSAFSEAGLLPGDKIIKMECENFSSSVKTYNDILFFAYQSGDDEADITVRRDDEILVFSVTPKYDAESGKKIFGFRPAPCGKNLFSVISLAFWQSVFVVKIVLISFWQMITGTVPVSSISGPIGIINEINTAAKTGVFSVLNLASLISINLGVVNLFPFPALDGGRIVFLILEKIRKKPLSRNQEGFIHMIGFAILMIAAVLITFSDITKLFGA